MSSDLLASLFVPPAQGAGPSEDGDDHGGMHGGDGDEKDGETGGQGMQDEEEDAAPPATMSRDEAVESVQARLSALAVRFYAADVTAMASSRQPLLLLRRQGRMETALSLQHRRLRSVWPRCGRS